MIVGDFRRIAIEDRFDVVLGLGVFDYLPDAEHVLRRMFELCSGAAVLSFPRRHWTKSRARKIRYERFNQCPIYDYTEEEVRALAYRAGFRSVRSLAGGRWGFFVRADTESAAHRGRAGIPPGP
jgi:hypothetical protein